MSADNSSRGIEAKCAAFAYQTVLGFFHKEPAEKNRKEYRAYLRKFPTMVLTNGVGQSLAFYYSKGGQYREIYNGLEAWMRQVDELFGGIGAESDLMDKMLRMKQDQYRLATKQLLHLVGWMSRFADGFLVNDQQVPTQVTTDGNGGQ